MAVACPAVGESVCIGCRILKYHSWGQTQGYDLCHQVPKQPVRFLIFWTFYAIMSHNHISHISLTRNPYQLKNILKKKKNNNIFLEQVILSAFVSLCADVHTYRMGSRLRRTCWRGPQEWCQPRSPFGSQSLCHASDLGCSAPLLLSGHTAVVCLRCWVLHMHCQSLEKRAELVE